MGKKIKAREAQRRAAEAAVSALLKLHSRTETGPAVVTAWDEFAPDCRARIDAFRDRALRAPEQWRRRVRTRLPEKRFLDLVRHTFARFPVAAHLENLWLDDADAFAVAMDAREGPDRRTDWNHYFRSWYIVAAQGGSLYREAGADRFMSRRETHHFLTAPKEVSWTQQAFWYAFARAHCGDRHAALRVACTTLVARPIHCPFWKGVARYFARHPLSILEMNDLIGFFAAARAENERFSLRQRSLAALRARSQAWHRALREQQHVGWGRWDGHPLPDVQYDAGSGRDAAIWRLRQIKTGKELFKEGERMHHCVASYKPECMSGDASIWSLSCEYPLGRVHRGVTVEVRKDGRIVQCHGFANRAPYPNELVMLKRWAADFGLAVKLR